MPEASPTDINKFERAAELIAQADALLITAGAGMGVDSGLPDFRGNEGFWKAYPALAKAQLDFTEVADPLTFTTDMRMGWGFYGHRLNLYRQTQPHAGFGILKRWADAMPLGARVFTSNVDGQFQKAGFTPEQLHECHGSIHHLQCLGPCQPSIWAADDFAPQVDEAHCRLSNAPPTCPACGGLARPNILMFGDGGWLDARQDAQQQREEAWFEQVVSRLGRVVIVEMGAGTAIASVRNYSQRISRRYGARIIRINPREPQVPSTQDVGIATGSLTALTRIDIALQYLQGESR